MWFGSFLTELKGIIRITTREFSEDSPFNSGKHGGVMGRDRSAKCGTGRIADGRFGYKIFFLFLWLYPLVLVKPK